MPNSLFEAPATANSREAIHLGEVRLMRDTAWLRSMRLLVFSVWALWKTRLGLPLSPNLGCIASRGSVAVLIGLLLFGSTPQAQAEKSAKASVNNHIVYQEANVAPGVIRRDAGANGVSVAGAKVYHPVKEDFRVSQGDGGDAGNQPASESEATTIRKLLKTAKSINEQAPKKPHAPTPFELHKVKFYQDVFTGLLDFIYHGTDGFSQIAKDADKPLKAITDPLFNPDALEAAKSEATQTLTKTGNTADSPRQLTMVEKPSTEVRKVKNGAKMPMAAAIAVNLDPMGVEWDSPASLGVSLDDVSLDVESSENGSSAVATLHADALFINGTSDIETPPDNAMPLFSLDLLALSYAGTEPFIDLTLDTYGNSVFDSLGNTNVTDVTQALLDALVIDGSTVSFTPGYSFGLELPDDPDESVLFPRTMSSATVVTAPEPGTLLLAAVALFGAVKLTWRRRRWCVTNGFSS